MEYGAVPIGSSAQTNEQQNDIQPLTAQTQSLPDNAKVGLKLDLMGTMLVSPDIKFINTLLTADLTMVRLNKFYERQTKVVKGILSRKRGPEEDIEEFGVQLQKDQAEATKLQASTKYAIDICQALEKQARKKGEPLGLTLRDVERAKVAVGLVVSKHVRKTSNLISKEDEDLDTIAMAVKSAANVVAVQLRGKSRVTKFMLRAAARKTQRLMIAMMEQRKARGGSIVQIEKRVLGLQVSKVARVVTQAQNGENTDGEEEEGDDATEEEEESTRGPATIAPIKKTTVPSYRPAAPKQTRIANQAPEDSMASETRKCQQGNVHEVKDYEEGLFMAEWEEDIPVAKKAKKRGAAARPIPKPTKLRLPGTREGKAAGEEREKIASGSKQAEMRLLADLIKEQGQDERYLLEEFNAQNLKEGPDLKSYVDFNELLVELAKERDVSGV